MAVQSSMYSNTVISYSLYERGPTSLANEVLPRSRMRFYPVPEWGFTSMVV